MEENNINLGGCYHDGVVYTTGYKVNGGAIELDDKLFTTFSTRQNGGVWAELNKLAESFNPSRDVPRFAVALQPIKIIDDDGNEKCSRGEICTNCIFDEINDWLLRGHFGLCALYLQSISVDKCSTNKLLTILTATLPASIKLPERSKFYNKVRNILQERGEDADTLLSGLNRVEKKEPLPCPFCGGEVAPYEIVSIGQYYIQCYNNNCEVNPSIDGPSDSEEDVISRWNKRREKS